MSPKPKDSYVPPDEIDGKTLSPAMKKYLKDNPQHRGDGWNAKLYRGVNELGDKAMQKLKEKNKMAEQKRRDAAAAKKEADKTDKKPTPKNNFAENFDRSKEAVVARGANNRSKKVLTAEERMKGSKYDEKSFGTAFKAARKAGMKGFMHGGKKYNTKTAEEKDSGRKMSAPAEKATRKNQASSYLAYQ